MLSEQLAAMVRLGSPRMASSRCPLLSSRVSLSNSILSNSSRSSSTRRCSTRHTLLHNSPRLVSSSRGLTSAPTSLGRISATRHTSSNSSRRTRHRRHSRRSNHNNFSQRNSSAHLSPPLSNSTLRRCAYQKSPWSTTT